MAYRSLLVTEADARGRAKDRSDFDLGVISDEPMPLEDFYAVEDLIEASPTLYRVVWVDLTRVSPKFRTTAPKWAEILYET